MRIYVAGKWEEKSRVRVAQQILRDVGHEITFDWTQQPSTEDEVELNRQCIQDIKGVMSADAIVAVLIDEDTYLCDSANRYVEIGIAIGSTIPVYILGEPREDFLFRRYTNVHTFKTMQEIIDAIHKSY